MKKFIINIILVGIFVIVYTLHQSFFSWFTIAGIKPNLFIIFVLFIGLFANKKMGVIYGIITGLILDLLLGQVIGIRSVVYGLVGFAASMFERNFSKDNRITIMIVVLVTTIVSEILVVSINAICLDSTIGVLAFVQILAIETIFNLLISIILYPVIQKFGFYIENEYKGNQILTRYF